MTDTFRPAPAEEQATGLSRRSVLARTAAGLGIAVSGSIPGLLGKDAAFAKHGNDDNGHGNGDGDGHDDEVGYGPLIDDPAGRLALPAGFSYTLIAESGVTKLETGEPTPSDPDGTASFVRKGGNGDVLINNHEISGTEPFLVPHVAGFVYDETTFGGTTNIEVDNKGNRVREYVSLAGTSTNCAGGRTPWETWLTCEETEEIKGKPHGYVFEVDPYRQENNRDPKPIKAFGRFAHESLAVDPRRHTIYLTEDATAPNGLLYRWTPPDEALPLGPGVLRTLADDAGTLEAMKASDANGTHVPDLSVATQPGTTYKVEWVDVPDRDAMTKGSTRTQFTNDQITRSRKLEGMWWGEDGAYFVASFARTSDGSAAQHDGQVWFIDPEAQTIELKLWFAFTPTDQDNDPDGPDNITVSAFGGLFIAEDGEGQQHLIGSTESGAVFFFARNMDPGNEEFTGPNFSHDKKFLFANVQVPGRVFAIQGPFRKQR